MLFKVFRESSKPVCFFLLGKERKPFYFEGCCLGKCETHTCLGVMGERKQHLLSCFGKVRNSYLFKSFLGKCEAYFLRVFSGKCETKPLLLVCLGNVRNPHLFERFWESAKPTFI